MLDYELRQNYAQIYNETMLNMKKCRKQRINISGRKTKVGDPSVYLSNSAYYEKWVSRV